MIRYTNFRNIKVRHSDTGKGRAIVLLHGFPESLEIWKDLAEPLSKRFRVIAIDLPGFGETPSIGYAHSMELMAECVKAVMDSIGYRQYFLVGHSMGGYVALAFAEMFPKNIAGFCLFHSSALPDSEEKKKDRVRAVEIVKKDQKHYVSELVNKLFAPGNTDKYKAEINSIKEIGYKTSPQGIINALLGMKDRHDRRKIIENSPVPILFIIGKEDLIMPFQSLIDQAALNTKASTLLLENCGHMGFIEEKEKTAKAILKFAGKALRKKKKP